MRDLQGSPNPGLQLDADSSAMCLNDRLTYFRQISTSSERPCLRPVQQIFVEGPAQASLDTSYPPHSKLCPTWQSASLLLLKAIKSEEHMSQKLIGRSNTLSTSMDTHCLL